VRRLPESEVVARVLAAWRALRPGAPPPDRVQVLLSKKKSAICRLFTADGSLIAKRTGAESAALERRVHAEILPALPLSHLEWHGAVECPADPHDAWLLLEDAGDPPVVLDSVGDPHELRERPEDCPLVAGWLATLHASSLGSPLLSGLPDRGPEAARLRLDSARGTILASLGHPERPESRAELDPILAALDVLARHWAEIEHRCQALPRTLVHGDFVPKNMSVRERAGDRELLVYDWEHAGCGPPGQDLGKVDLAHYAAVLRQHWTGVDDAWLRRLADTGRYFRLISEIDWAASRLGLRGSEYFVEELRTHARELATRFRAEGWAPGTG
jgi:hypothetical protein